MNSFPFIKVEQGIYLLLHGARRGKGPGKKNRNGKSPATATPQAQLNKRKTGRNKRKTGRNKHKTGRNRNSPVMATPPVKSKQLVNVARSSSKKKGSRRRHTPKPKNYQDLKDLLRYPMLSCFDAAFCAVDPSITTLVWNKDSGFDEAGFADFALPIIDAAIGPQASKETVRSPDQ